MVTNNHKREFLFEQMNNLLQQEDFYFLKNGSATQNITGKSTMRSKTSGHQPLKKNWQNSKFLESTNEFTSRMNSTRGMNKKNAHLTGINTYKYEVSAVPLRESFMNSMHRRKRIIRDSIKGYSKSGERSRSKMRGTKINNHKLWHKKVYPKKLQKVEYINSVHNNSIFENMPKRFKPKMSTSVDESSKVKSLNKSSIDFKNLPADLQQSMHNRVDNVLNQKHNRVRNNSKTRSNRATKDTRGDIAVRILSMLQGFEVPKIKSEPFQ